MNKAHIRTIAHLIREHLKKIKKWHKKQCFFYCLLHAIFYHPTSDVKPQLETNMH